MKLDEPTLRGLEARIKLAREKPANGGVIVGLDVLEALVAAARRASTATIDLREADNE